MASPAEQQAITALLNAAVDAALADVESDPDPRRRLSRAGEVERLLHDAAERAAKVADRAAGEILDGR
jgi:hypothetical protein